MTPEQKIKHAIIARAILNEDFTHVGEINASNVDQLWSDFYEVESSMTRGDHEEEFRTGEVETEIKAERSRCYETKSVAAKMPDGSWVGWTYWYGGGKHGDPGSIDWMEYAYDLECEEEEKLVTVRTFTKAVELQAVQP